MANRSPHYSPEIEYTKTVHSDGRVRRVFTNQDGNVVFRHDSHLDHEINKETNSGNPLISQIVEFTIQQDGSISLACNVTIGEPCVVTLSKDMIPQLRSIIYAAGALHDAKKKIKKANNPLDPDKPFHQRAEYMENLPR